MKVEELYVKVIRMKNRLIMIIILLVLLVGTLLGILLKCEDIPEYKFVLPSKCELNKLKILPSHKVEFELPGVEAYQEGHTQEEKADWVPPITGDNLTEEELELVYAVVMQEGGPTYESAEAVMSTIVNRVNNPDKWGWAGNTIIDQITYPQQYCYSLDDYWVKYLDGNVPDTVKWGVLSVLEYGPSHHYDCFRGYYLEGCEQISDNWYFVG